MPSYFPKFFIFFDVEATGVFSRVVIYIGHKFKHDKTKQGPNLALFLEVHFLENLVFSRAPNPKAKKALKTVTTVTTLS